MEYSQLIAMLIVGAAAGGWELLKWSFRKESERWAKVDAEVARRIDELHK